MKTVLIVDDSAFMRKVVRDIVTKQGFTVVGEARNGRIGVEMYKELKPDIVTMDSIMEEMGGLAALELIMSHDPDAVVIMLSSMMGQQSFMETAKSLGAKEVLTKPVEPKKFCSVLKRYYRGDSIRNMPHHEDESQNEGQTRNHSESGSEREQAWIPDKNDESLEVFCKNAKRAITTLRQTAENGNIGLFTVAIHAMRSSLTSIEEYEMSDMANYLEVAGHNNNASFIINNADKFIDSLEQVVEKHSAVNAI